MRESFDPVSLIGRAVLDGRAQHGDLVVERLTPTTFRLVTPSGSWTGGARETARRVQRAMVFGTRDLSDRSPRCPLCGAQVEWTCWSGDIGAVGTARCSDGIEVTFRSPGIGPACPWDGGRVLRITEADVMLLDTEPVWAACFAPPALAEVEADLNRPHLEDGDEPAVDLDASRDSAPARVERPGLRAMVDAWLAGIDLVSP